MPTTTGQSRERAARSTNWGVDRRAIDETGQKLAHTPHFVKLTPWRAPPGNRLLPGSGVLQVPTQLRRQREHQRLLRRAPLLHVRKALLAQVVDNTLNQILRHRGSTGHADR